VDIQLNGFIMHTGEHLLYHVENNTGVTIDKGTPVMFEGTIGSSGKLRIEPWNGTGPSAYFMGLTAEDLSQGEEGFVIAFGKLRGIQTNGGNYSQTWTNGEIIYAGTTTGSLTDTQPVAPNPHIQVCAVISAHPSNGTLFVRPTLGSNIKDDEGVTITSLTTGDLLVATSGGASGVFENKAMSGDATLASTGALTIANDAVTYAKMQNVSAASRLLGRGSAAGSGDVEEITLGSGLSLSGTTLSATGGGTGDVSGPSSSTDNAIVRFDLTTGKLIQNSGITIADGTSGTLAGRNSGDVTLNASVADIFGLTGQELTADDPAADRIVFWDDSASKLTHLEVGSGLSISGTTITATGGAGATHVILGSDVTITDNLTLQNITGLSFAVSASTNYSFYVIGVVVTSAAGAGYEFGITGPSSPTFWATEARAFNATAGANSPGMLNSVSGAYGTIALNANGSVTGTQVVGSGVFQNGSNAGNVQFTAKVENGVTGSVTFKAGTRIIYWQTA
jgi:hypothetical protein